MDKIATSNPTGLPARVSGSPEDAPRPEGGEKAAQQEALSQLKQAKEKFLNSGATVPSQGKQGGTADEGLEAIPASLLADSGLAPETDSDLPGSLPPVTGRNQGKEGHSAGGASVAPEGEGAELDPLAKPVVGRSGEGDEESSKNKGQFAGDSDNNLGNAILQSMGSESSAFSQLRGVEGAEAASHLGTDFEKIETLISKVANRVLVTDPASGQNAEVRVQIAPDLMPGTEVKVWKGDGGRLFVEFDTTSPQWAKVLSDSVSALSDRLGARINLHEAPQVSVRDSSDGSSRDHQSEHGGSGQQQQREDPRDEA